MLIANKSDAAVTASFVENGSDLHLELTNATDQTLKCIEVLTIFLKDHETPGGGPSRAHIRFDAIQNLQARERKFDPLAGTAEGHDHLPSRSPQYRST